ncbi:hypothetical protein ACFX11_012822 [Malus domestica]
MMVYKKTQEVTDRDTKSTLDGVHFEIMLAHIKESLLNIIQMHSAALRFDDHIIDIYFYDRTNQVMKDGIHNTLVCVTRIFKGEWHDNPLVGPKCPWATKGSFVYIDFGDKDLVVASMAIHEG